MKWATTLTFSFDSSSVPLLCWQLKLVPFKVHSPVIQEIVWKLYHNVLRVALVICLYLGITVLSAVEELLVIQCIIVSLMNVMNYIPGLWLCTNALQL